MVISVNAIFGVLARLGIGFLSDKVGRRTAFLLSCVTQLVLLIGLLVAFSTVSTWAFIILAWLISSAYGANFPLMPATLADLFSAHFVSTCHGISLTAWALASIVGGVLDNLLFTFLVPSTYLASDPGLYKVTIYWLLACQVIAIFIMTLCMRFTPQDRLYPSVPGQLFRIRLGPYLLRVTDRPRVEVVGPKQQESEWQAFLTANNLVS
jgi:MFS family permease